MADIDPAVRNRLLILTQMWREFSEEPLPRVPPGPLGEQLAVLERLVVDAAFEAATPANAKRVADATWDLVHDRPDGDPLKQRVSEGHSELARLSHGRTAGGDVDEP